MSESEREQMGSNGRAYFRLGHRLLWLIKNFMRRK
jgi:hypothetical protein